MTPMDGKRSLLWLSVVVTLVATGGANCSQMVRPPMPPVLHASPSIEEVVKTVNDNSRQIQSFSTNQASIKVPGAPTLRANLAMQRPRRFRLQAETLMGPELDVGSNEELFWFWIRQSQEPGVYYCRHGEFDSSRAQRMIPVSPDQLVEAMGLMELNPALPHQGPFTRPDGRLEIHTIVDTPSGPNKKVTIIDQNYGWVLAQHFYDSHNNPLLSVNAQDHRQDPLSGLVMPKKVLIECPRSQFRMEVVLGDVEINTLSQDRGQLWKMPAYRGSPPIDLGCAAAPAQTTYARQ
ncbi:MAG: hypothetical protein JXM70_15925 [Pirellulales bacterium]|nr:hypothetical protein [Pirellulales bacterium]